MGCAPSKSHTKPGKVSADKSATVEGSTKTIVSSVHSKIPTLAPLAPSGSAAAPKLSTGDEEEENEYENNTPYKGSLVHVQLVDGKWLSKEHGKTMVFDPSTKTTSVFTADNSTALPTIVGEHKPPHANLTRAK